MSTWYLYTGNKPTPIPNGAGNTIVATPRMQVEIHRLNSTVQRLVRERKMRRCSAPKVKPAIPVIQPVVDSPSTKFATNITELGVVKSNADLRRIMPPAPAVEVEENSDVEKASEKESPKKKTRRRKRATSTDE